MSVDERQLIADCLRGRTEAFGELVRRYQDRLYNTVYRLVGHAEDAHDIVQEAFLHAYQSLHSFQGNARFFTWLYRIAFNAAISHKRKQRALFRREPQPLVAAIEPVDPSNYGKPGHALEQAEQERRIQDALRRLSAEHRAVLILKDLEGEKYEDMAAILGVPIGTIRSRLHRARLELRELLSKPES